WSGKTLSRAAGERLCLQSSVLPRRLIADDGVEDGEELSGDGDAGDDPGLAGVDEPLSEGAQCGIEATCGQSAEIQHAAHAAASAANEALALPRAGLAGPPGPSRAGRGLGGGGGGGIWPMRTAGGAGRWGRGRVDSVV